MRRYWDSSLVFARTIIRELGDKANSIIIYRANVNTGSCSRKSEGIGAKNLETGRSLMTA